MAVKLPTSNKRSGTEPAPGQTVTYEEFLDLSDGIHAEWVDGEVLVMSPAGLPHQRIALFLSRIISHFVDLNGCGEALLAPYNMRLESEQRGREPDIAFVASENLERLKPTHLEGPADLVVEIVSPDSALRDRGEKYAEYESAGVREYWILDPGKKRADFFVLGADGAYERVRPDLAGVYQSTVLDGFWLAPSWLWQSPLPGVAGICAKYDADAAHRNTGA